MHPCDDCPAHPLSTDRRPDISAEIARRLTLPQGNVRLLARPGPFPPDGTIRWEGGWQTIRAEPRPAILRWYAITFALMAGVFVLLMLPARRIAHSIGRAG
ncbi:MAG TPA: hypothetical protein VF475_15420 [Sphingobium sp.]